MKLRLDWQRLGLYHMQADPPTVLQNVLQKHGAVFRDELGLVKGVTAKDSRGYKRMTPVL